MANLILLQYYLVNTNEDTRICKFARIKFYY